MTFFTQDLALVDELSHVRALLDCAFMACTALDDETQANALQSLLNTIDDRLVELGRQVAPCPALAA